MSITQTYYLAHTARRKLSKEASRADHNLRLLVSHANLLDSLMIELSNAEKEQERWFNQTVTTAYRASSSGKDHIQWADSIVEDIEEDWDAEDVSDDSDSDSEVSCDEDNNDEDGTSSMTSLRLSIPLTTQQEDGSQSDGEEDDEEDRESLALTRHSPPPELLEDLSDDSEDDVSPPSPPQPTFSIFDSRHPNKLEGVTITETEMASFSDEYISPHGASTMIPAY